MGGFKPLEKRHRAHRQAARIRQTAAAYVGKRVTDKPKPATGQAMRGEWKQTLTAVAERYGVQPEIILAIWGMETNFGGYMGGNNTVHALATLTYGGYRADYFRDELSPRSKSSRPATSRPGNDRLVGRRHGPPAVHALELREIRRRLQGRGPKDIWNSVPDALASTANYLKSLRLARRRDLGL